MNFGYRRSYRGPIEAVLLDWAGTTMDFGCMAPAVVFVEVFKRKRVPITTEEARARPSCGRAWSPGETVFAPCRPSMQAAPAGNFMWR